ncbi:22819_t:CDS:2, partial [Racocetra persica]
NDLLLPELQYTSVDQSNQIETKDDRSEATTDSDDSGAIIRLIISGTSFLSWISLEKSLEYYGKKNGKTEQKIYINKLIEEHNHSLTPYREEFAPSLQRLSQNILDEIKFMIQKCEYNARQQRWYLVNKFPGVNIYSKNLYNAIRHYKTPTASKINQDATLMLEYLIFKQRKDPN